MVGTAAPRDDRRWAMRPARRSRPISAMKLSNTPASGSCRYNASRGSCTGTSSFKVTSCRLIRAWSACSIRLCRRFGCLISPARRSTPSRSPYSLINNAAVLTPIPGTPGTLSVASPHRAWTSITRSGPTPNFSCTWSGPISRCFMGSRMPTPPPISCIKSLSELTMVTSMPASRARRA